VPAPIRLVIATALVPLLVSCASADSGTSSTASSPTSAAARLAGGAPSAAPTPSPTPAPAPTASASAAPRAPVGDGQKGTRALFFGDSYFVGGGYTGADNSMAAIAANRLGWAREIRGGGGTGFVSGNPQYGIKSFLGQIRGGALDVGPVDWLVIEGGGNDRLDKPSLIKRKAVAVLRAAARRHPEARLVLVGTMDPTVDGFADTDGVIGALRRAAAAVGVPYINAQRWFEGRPDLIGPDYDHPLPQGHRLAGGKLAQALRALR
jgi:lysophospholipase L1-like esterase